MWLRTANRLLAQEALRGELSIILLAIALAVMAVYSLSGFANRIQQALESKSSSFLAADRVLKCLAHRTITLRGSVAAGRSSQF
jgi:putative ABC transport system permease protein